MQPIAVDKHIFEEIFSSWDEDKTIQEFIGITQNLKKYHQIFACQGKTGISDWQEYIIQLKSKFTSPAIINFIDALLNPSYLNFITTSLTNPDKEFEEYLQKTHDHIGLSNRFKELRKLFNIYNTKTFTKEELPPSCLLYRLPKTVKVRPDYKFSNLSFLAPYLRDATKIEIMDKQLFRDARNDTEVKLLLEILSFVPGIKELQLYWQPNNANIRYLSFIRYIQDRYPEVKLLDNQQYASRTKNHDRFIIVNEDEISIRFTCSFNNFYMGNGTYKTKAGFSINYERGRSFYD